MDKRKFNGGKREGAGRKREYTDPSDLIVRMEKDLRNKGVEKLGSLTNLKDKVREYIEELVKD